MCSLNGSVAAKNYHTAPYGCASYGDYGPEWFSGGAFVGAGPWFHGGHNFQGQVNNRLHRDHGYLFLAFAFVSAYVTAPTSLTSFPLKLATLSWRFDGSGLSPAFDVAPCRGLLRN